MGQGSHATPGDSAKWATCSVLSPGIPAEKMWSPRQNPVVSESLAGC